MKKSEKVSMTSLFLILIASVGMASVTSITWSRTFTFTITGGTTGSTANFAGYSNSGCTSAIASGGSEDLGSFGPSVSVVKNFYIKDTSAVGGTVHWNFTATTAPAGYVSGGMFHVHADSSLHTLESHAISATECLPVRLSMSFISPYNTAGAKTVTVNLGRV
ncbi:MAG: hypothetical protein HY514_03245 [Candidatus Aenigmarchaeota archaeon]|nr:hypothetical protein [Candidatus Aenigmarchaeota archaeon]